MRKLVPVLLLMILVLGCGKKGDTGPAGPKGDTGTGIQTYSISFTEGVYPYSSYTGTTMNTVDAANPTTAYSINGTINFASSGSSVSRVLMRWPIAGYIPNNATIASAQVQLVISSITVSQNKTIGIHEMLNGDWNNNATWNAPNPPGNPSWYPGPVTFSKGDDYSSSSMGTITLKPTTTTETRFAWNITNSVVQSWINSNSSTDNKGIVFTSENEGSDTSGSVVFYSPTASSQYCPTLVIQYTIP